MKQRQRRTWPGFLQAFIISFLLSSTVSAALPAKFSDEYKVADHSGFSLFAQKEYFCDLYPDESPYAGYKQCHPVVAFYTGGQDSVNINLSTALMKLDISVPVKDGKITYNYSTNCTILNSTAKERGTYKLECFDWQSMESVTKQTTLSKNSFIGVMINFLVDAYSKATYNYTYAPSGLAATKLELDPNINACGDLTTNDATYTMTTNVNQDCETTCDACMHITGANITLNCQNHWINNSAGYHDKAGVRLAQAANWTTIKNCKIKNFYDANVWINDDMQNTIIVDSIIIGSSGYGILFGGDHANATRNNITSNSHGFAFADWGSHNNLLYDNKIAGNTNYIECLQGVSQTVEHQDMNVTKTYSYAGNILGGDTIGGNYWGSCTDNNKDGICDSPRSFCSGNYTDYLPLSLELDQTLPSAHSNSPGNQTESSTSVNSFTCNATDDRNLGSLTLYAWNSTGSSVGTNTTTVSGTSASATMTLLLHDGANKWICYGCDATTVNCNTSFEGNRTITVDTKPTVHSTSPANQASTYLAAPSFTGSVAFTGGVQNLTLYVRYINGSLVGTNTSTLSGSSNTTTMSLNLPTEGTYTWIFQGCSNQASWSCNWSAEGNHTLNYGYPVNNDSTIESIVYGLKIIPTANRLYFGAYNITMKSPSGEFTCCGPSMTNQWVCTAGVC